MMLRPDAARFTPPGTRAHPKYPQGVPKRRMSAPAEFTVAPLVALPRVRKRTRLSDLDDDDALIDKPAASHAVGALRVSEPDAHILAPSPLSAHRNPSPASSQGKATIANRYPHRPKPNLSVHIPPPSSFFMRSSSNSNTSIIDDKSSQSPSFTQEKRSSTPLRTPLPITPLDQLLHRPSNPPAIPRHAPNDDEPALKRRAERLWAPTPTEWSFSSTLNRVPTPVPDVDVDGTVVVSMTNHHPMLLEPNLSTPEHVRVTNVTSSSSSPGPHTIAAPHPNTNFQHSLGSLRTPRPHLHRSLSTGATITLDPSDHLNCSSSGNNAGRTTHPTH